jgi:hypothetical protein
MNEYIRHPWIGPAIVVLFCLDFWVALGYAVWRLW